MIAIRLLYLRCKTVTVKSTKRIEAGCLLICPLFFQGFCGRRAWATGRLTGGDLGAQGKTGAKPAKSRRRHGWHLRRPPRPRDDVSNGDAATKVIAEATARRSPLPRFTRIPGETIYGALDLGTNNCRLLLARPAQTGFEVVDAFRALCALVKVFPRQASCPKAR